MPLNAVPEGGNAVGGCAVDIGLLVGLIHVDLLVKQQFENSPSDADACPSAQVPGSHLIGMWEPVIENLVLIRSFRLWLGR